ncbi:MAG: glycoside hydrolase family 27 protein [Thermoanaerobaculia bacterium]
MRVAVLLIPLLLAAAGASAQKYDGLATTPPMGWNSWNHFGCNVDEAVVRAAADAMVASGMKAAGYEYVVIDDCWQGTRDEMGFIRPDPDRFPSGMKALADYVHAKGLRLGIYSDAGAKTCAGRPGSRGHEYQDAKTFASWGVDYLKYDWCNTEGLNAKGAYTTMRDALRAAGRPVVLGICEWGENQPWAWGKDVGHLWRTTGDITSCFDCVVDHGSWKSWGVMPIVDKQDGLRGYAGPGHWNDPDMLEVGNGMSDAEDRAHVSLWAMLAAPLIAGNDLSKMRPETAAILTNREVIAVDQDRLGIQGFRHRTDGKIEIWARPLADGEWAVLFLNRSETPRTAQFDWSAERIEDALFGRDLTGSPVYDIRDLWANRPAGDTARPFSATIAPHDVVMLRLTPRLIKEIGE